MGGWVMALFRLTSRSTAHFEARSSLHPIKAQCKSVTGYLRATMNPDGVIDPENGVEGRIEIPIVALASGNPLYDRELRKRMESDRYPTIIGDLKTAIHEGEGRYRVGGDIMVRGQSQEASEEMEISLAANVLHLTGSHTFDMRDFQIEPPRLAMIKVHPEVTVSVDLYAEGE